MFISVVICVSLQKIFSLYATYYKIIIHVLCECFRCTTPTS